MYKFLLVHNFKKSFHGELCSFIIFLHNILSFSSFYKNIAKPSFIFNNVKRNWFKQKERVLLFSTYQHISWLSFSLCLTKSPTNFLISSLVQNGKHSFHHLQENELTKDHLPFHKVILNFTLSPHLCVCYSY